MHLLDKRPAGKIAIDDDLKDVVVQIVAPEIPVVVVGFVEKVEPVEAFHPAQLSL